MQRLKASNSKTEGEALVKKPNYNINPQAESLKLLPSVMICTICSPREVGIPSDNSGGFLLIVFNVSTSACVEINPCTTMD